MTTMTPEIRAFLRQLLQDAGQTNLGEELENVLIGDLYPRLVDRMILTAVAHLNEGKQAELLKMADEQADKETVEQFLRENVANFDQVFGKTMEEFREIYIEASKS